MALASHLRHAMKVARACTREKQRGPLQRKARASSGGVDEYARESGACAAHYLGFGAEREASHADVQRDIAGKSGKCLRFW